MAEPMTFEAVYLGQIGQGEKGKWLHAFLRLDNDEKMHFGKLKGEFVGAVHEFTDQGDEKYIKGQYLYRSEDERMPDWVLNARTAEVNRRATRTLAKDKAESADAIGKMTMDEVREMMGSRWGMNRTALLATVMEYVQR